MSPHSQRGFDCKCDLMESLAKTADVPQPSWGQRQVLPILIPLPAHDHHGQCAWRRMGACRGGPPPWAQASCMAEGGVQLAAISLGQLMNMCHYTTRCTCIHVTNPHVLTDAEVLGVAHTSTGCMPLPAADTVSFYSIP